MRFFREVATRICGKNTTQSALTTKLPMPQQQIPWRPEQQIPGIGYRPQHNSQAGSLQPTQQGINPHQYQAQNKQLLYRQGAMRRASPLATIPQQAIFQAQNKQLLYRQDVMG